MDESMLTFWVTFAAAGIAQAVCFALPLSLGLRPVVPCVVARDFPLWVAGNRPLDHPEVYGAVRRTFRGWRAIGLAVMVGLVFAGTQVAWDAALPFHKVGRGFWPQFLRTLVCVLVSFWFSSRVVVASAYRHIVTAEAAARNSERQPGGTMRTYA
jgi:hypothetical protein